MKYYVKFERFFLNLALFISTGSKNKNKNTPKSTYNIRDFICKGYKKKQKNKL